MHKTFQILTPLLSCMTTFALLGSTGLNAQETKGATPLKTIRNTSSMIDQAVEKDLVSEKLAPFDIIDDPTFLRRAYVGITGRIPTHKETIQFLGSKQQDKRAKLIDSLVYSSGYESKIFNYWADLLRLETNDEQYGVGWHVWLRESVSENKPYNKMVHEMLSASGHASQNPAVGYYLRDRNMLLDNISNTVQVFLGTQIGCAQCHDDPFEDWTQKQYYELAAFGANIEYNSKTAKNKIQETVEFIADKNGIKPTKNKQNKEKKNFKKNNRYKKFVRKTSRDLYSVFNRFNKNEIVINNNKTLRLPDDYPYNDGKPGDIVMPNPIFHGLPKLHHGSNRLENFANWVTDPKNPQFTKTIANRLWKHVYGYGLAEPLDNWTDRTKVSHPEALKLVEKILIKNDYNIRETLRILYHTQLFQRTVSTQEITPGSTYSFQGPVLRRLSAEELHDSILTLEKGNLDDRTNQGIKSKWENYTKRIQYLLDAKPETIVKINSLADDAEKKINSAKAEARRLRLAKEKAIGEGDTAKANAIQKQLRDVYAKIKSKQKQSTNMAMTENSMAGAMVEMTMMNVLRVKSKGFYRASEMPAPARGGHFLNRFGASDRQTSSAAHTDASIPQTLTLLNGKEITAVTDKKGTLPNLLMRASSASEKLDILFTSIYSRYPTASEKAKYKAYMNNPKQIQILAKAMLNSKRFLFLQ